MKRQAISAVHLARGYENIFRRFVIDGQLDYSLVYRLRIGRSLGQLCIHLGAHCRLGDDVQCCQTDEGIHIEGTDTIGLLLQTLHTDVRLLIEDLDELFQDRKVERGRNDLAPLMPHLAIAKEQPVPKPLAQQLVHVMLHQMLLAGEHLLIELQIAAEDH